jgi:hypothetical protein
MKHTLFFHSLLRFFFLKNVIDFIFPYRVSKLGRLGLRPRPSPASTFFFFMGSSLFYEMVRDSSKIATIHSVHLTGRAYVFS